jgi:hypothetical protein
MSNIKERMVIERNDIVSRIDSIKNSLSFQESSLIKLKKVILNEYLTMSMELANQTEPRVREYIEYLNIAIANHNKGINDIIKERDMVIEKSAKEREKWLNSLRQSLDMGLIR